jgi:hypothetical protein
MTAEGGVAAALAVTLLVSVVLRRIILIGRQDSLYTLHNGERQKPFAATAS